MNIVQNLQNRARHLPDIKLDMEHQMPLSSDSPISALTSTVIAIFYVSFCKLPSLQPGPTSCCTFFSFCFFAQPPLLVRHLVRNLSAPVPRGSLRFVSREPGKNARNGCTFLSLILCRTSSISGLDKPVRALFCRRTGRVIIYARRRFLASFGRKSH